MVRFKLRTLFIGSLSTVWVILRRITTITNDEVRNMSRECGRGLFWSNFSKFVWTRKKRIQLRAGPKWSTRNTARRSVKEKNGQNCFLWTSRDDVIPTNMKPERRNKARHCALSLYVSMSPCSWSTCTDVKSNNQYQHTAWFPFAFKEPHETTRACVTRLRNWTVC